MLNQKLPQIEHIPDFVAPNKSQTLANLLLARSGIDPLKASQGKRFQHHLGYNYMRDALTHDRRTTSQALQMVCRVALPDNSDLLFSVAQGALLHMSGLKPDGIRPYFKPDSIVLDMNVYQPNEKLFTHMDNDIREVPIETDIVAITLDGISAKFLHALPTALERMPRTDEIIQSWDVFPGHAMAIRNHQTVDSTNSGDPPHAVQNGNGVRVTLQVEMFYKP